MFLFPDDNVSKEEKSKKDFGLGVLRAADQISRTNAFIGTFMNPRMVLREQYSDGNQPVEIYKKLFLGSSSAQVADGRADTMSGNDGLTSYVNINWAIYNPMVKLVSVLRSMFSARDYRVEVKSLDRTHMNEKADKKWRLYTRSVATNDLREEMGLPVPASNFQPKDIQSLELADKLGFFKLELESTLEKIIEHGFDISDWQKLRRKFQKNTIDHRFKVAKVECHPVTGAAMFRWVDPKKVVMQWNPDNLGENPLYIGFYESVQVKELANILLNEGYSEQEIDQQLKTAVSGLHKNVDFGLREGVFPSWYNFTVEVLHLEYVSTDYSTYYTGKNKEGKKKTVRAKYNEDGSIKENKFEDGETIEVNKDFLYEGSFIVGTDFCYNWGLCEHQLRDKKNNVMYSYVWDYLEGRSMTERAISILDDLQMCVYKLRAAVASAAPKGYDIDLGETANIVVQGKTLDIFALMKIHRETGIKVRKTVKNLQGQKEKLNPLEENEGGIGQQMNEWLTMIQSNIALLFDELGIPNVLAGQGIQSAEKAVGVINAEIGGAVNATFDEVESELIFKKRLAEVLVMKARVLIRYDDKVEDYYENLFGDTAIDSIKSIDGLTLEQLGITMTPRPTEAEKAQILQDCIELTKAGRDGFMPFTQSDLVMVRMLLNNDQLELATIYMSKTIEENKAKHLAEQQAVIQSNSEAQMQSAQAATQNELAIINAKAEAEARILQMKIELEGAMKERLQAQKGALELEQIKTEIAAEMTLGTQIRNPLD
jgi:hypothetical protein